MNITLIINNEEKTYRAPFISTRKLKNTIALSSKMQNINENDIADNLLDELIDYEVELYGKQFTRDDLLDGYPSNKFFNKIITDIEQVIGEFNTVIKN